MALNTFESEWTETEGNAELYYIDLLKNRDVSNRLAELSKIRHESPQVIVFKGNNVIYSASHSGINANEIKKIIKN
jgi:bacillithiol system protein YtxJ